MLNIFRRNLRNLGNWLAVGAFVFVLALVIVGALAESDTRVQLANVGSWVAGVIAGLALVIAVVATLLAQDAVSPEKQEADRLWSDIRRVREATNYLIVSIDLDGILKGSADFAMDRVRVAGDYLVGRMEDALNHGVLSLLSAVDEESITPDKPIGLLNSSNLRFCELLRLLRSELEAPSPHLPELLRPLCGRLWADLEELDYRFVRVATDTAHYLRRDRMTFFAQKLEERFSE